MSETEGMELTHKLRNPENEADIVPGIHYTLLSGVKFADANYVYNIG